jgi:hypothetical protein
MKSAYGKTTMEKRKDILTKTHESRARQISIARVETVTTGSKKGSLIGWEFDAPKRGSPYKVYLHEGMLLRTSPIQDFRETDKGLIIKTQNSVYQVEYLGNQALEVTHSG